MNTGDVKRKPLILCVEDEPSLRGDIVEELESAGYAVMAAGDGEEALAHVERARPDLVLCDVMMPGLDGYGVLEAVRGRRGDLVDVPFVFLTALGARDDVISGKRAGVDDYLVKPIDFDLMLASVGTCLKRTEQIKCQGATDMGAVRRGLEGLQGAALSEEAMRSALNLLALGVVLVDRQGKVLFANHAARLLTMELDGVSVKRGIDVEGRAPSAALRSILDDVGGASENGEEFTRGLALPRPSGGRDILLVASALTSGEPAAEGRPAAVIFLSDPDRRLDLSEDVVGSLFGLTSTESRIAIALAEGCRRDEIARRFEISQTTVAFHMRNLFQKTATHRQTDLIALILVGLMAISPDAPAA